MFRREEHAPTHLGDADNQMETHDVVQVHLLRVLVQEVVQVALFIRNAATEGNQPTNQPTKEEVSPSVFVPILLPKKN